MPDWRGKVSRKLEHSKFSPEERAEISSELGGYLDDLCDDASSHGFDDRLAMQRAFSEFCEDENLGENLFRARREGNVNLNDRTKQFWLPGIVMLLASTVLLATFQAAALWTYHAYAPMPHAQNYPDLVRNLSRHDGAALMIYLGWLYTLPFLGALGAYWSRRSGSGRLAQIATGLFPLLLFLAILIDQATAIERNTFVPFLGMGSLPPAHDFFPFLSILGNLFVSWLAIPGAALLLGVLPFSLKSGTRERGSAPALGVVAFGLALALSLACARASMGQAVASPRRLTAAQVVDLQKRFQDATVACDAAALAKLMADDVIFVHGNALVQSKADFLEAAQARRFRIKSFDIADPKVILFKDGAIVTGIENIVLGAAAAGEQPRKVQMRVSGVWVAKPGGWQLILQQSTPLQPLASQPATPSNAPPR
ncbi:MAG TPA: DUF4440 domain-containing protein [Candidatus Acidoferrales bacterium]|jgi:ketosteroid isomerase-like protein|nr:DUF4440 domain-containing protein [Candidatus Acidoferrales bacterium]